MRVSNLFKQWIQTGERRPLGTWLMAASPTTAEAIAHCGFDFAVIDMEHVPIDIGTTLELLRTLAGTSMQPVVRPPSGDPIMVKRLLDIGAQTLMFPFVETPEQAHRLVQSTRYPTTGSRGVAAVHRASRYGRVDDYFGHADEEISVIVQLETPEAVDRLEEIAAVPGVDAVFVGPGDLSASMGWIGRMGRDEVQQLLESAARRAADIGKPIGIVGPDPAMVNRFIGHGYSFVAINSDLGMMIHRALECVATVDN